MIKGGDYSPPDIVKFAVNHGYIVTKSNCVGPL